MAINILQLVLGAVTPGIVDKLGQTFGESPDALQKALGGAAPAILGALVQKGASMDGAGALIKMFAEGKIDAGMLDNIGDLLGGGDTTVALQQAGGGLLSSLLGDKLGGLATVLAGFAGIKGESAKGLMGVLGPLVMSGLLKQAPAGGFSPAGLMGVLGEQKEFVEKLLPPGMGAILGLGGATGAATPAAAHTPPPAAAAAEPAKKGGIMPWLIGLAALGVLGFLGLRGCEAPKVAEAPVAPVETAVPAAPETVTVTLPSGAALTLARGSIGEQLAGFLAGADAAPRTFTFDNLNFETGGATLTPESNATVEAIGDILSAYATAQVRLEGHTDNTGDPAANTALSQSRAEAVKAMLVARGVAAERIAAAGLGQDKPIGDNATEEGRAQNRRIELTVTAK